MITFLQTKLDDENYIYSKAILFELAIFFRRCLLTGEFAFARIGGRQICGLFTEMQACAA